MDTRSPNGRPAPRFRAMPRREALGETYPVAATRRARLLGLAFLEREEAGPGLLIPSCRAVHTIGMRFEIDVWFLGAYGEPVGVRRRLRRGRFAFQREARAVLEVPS